LWAEEQESELGVLKRQVATLMRNDTEKTRKIEELQRQITGMQAAAKPLPAETALDRALSQLGEAKVPGGTVAAPQATSKGSPGAKLIDVSLDVLYQTGGSTATEEQLPDLQGGGHDPKKRGFTLPQAELSFAGAVDPYFNAEMHLVTLIDEHGETGVELEEAFLTTQAMPLNLQVKAGHFLTEFGRINPTHPHAWNWLDQPIVNTRMFGEDGMRAPGFRISWLTPAPWFSQLLFGVQNANGGTMRSFLGNEGAPADVLPAGVDGYGIGGQPVGPRSVKGMRDLVYLARSDNSVDLTDTMSTKFGFSAAHGPNNTGPRGESWIYGLDFLLKWRPEDWPRTGRFLTLEAEAMRRHFTADRRELRFAPGLDTDGDGLPDVFQLTAPRRTLHDWGFYTQALYGFQRNWAIGLRLEYAAGEEDDLAVDTATGRVELASRSQDPFRDNRFRVSPMVQWRLSEFSRVRFQYNYDRADHLPDHEAHSFWVGLEFLIGAHPAHKY
jgi:hypothetical protein